MYSPINLYLWAVILLPIFTSILLIILCYTLVEAFKVSNNLKSLRKPYKKKKKSLKKLIRDYVFTQDLNHINVDNKYVINTINPHSYYVSKRDLEFHKTLINSDILLPDGIGIVMAAKVLLNKRIKKIAGADLHKHLLDKANQKEKRIFYLGASEQTLKLIKERVNKEFPHLTVGTYSPPYKASFSKEDSLQMVSQVNAFKPDILFVGMTAPKQEKWVAKNKEYLEPNIIASIGAVFDFYAGTKKRSSKFWIKLGLEWLPRLLKEPKRLWKRNFISTPYFLVYMLLEKLNFSILPHREQLTPNSNDYEAFNK